MANRDAIPRDAKIFRKFGTILLYIILLIPGGWGIFLKYPWDPLGTGDLKTPNTPEPPGWGIFLSRGVASLGMANDQQQASFDSR